MKRFKWDRLKAEVSSVLHVKFPVAEELDGYFTEGVLHSHRTMKSHLEGKQNEGTEHSVVYNVYNGGKLVSLCI